MFKTLIQTGGILSVVAAILIAIPVIAYILSGLIYAFIGYCIYLVIDEHNKELEDKNGKT